METPRKPAGPLGLGLLGVTAVTGIVLAVHGWSGRHSPAPGALSGSSAPPATAGPAQPSRPAGPPARAARPGASGATAAGPGPLLSAQPYAPYSFRVWPGSPSAAAQAALTGLSVNVRRQHSGIVVTAGVTGQPGSPSRFYARGATVYIIEASLGDDSGNSDYSLGDDGLVVTDVQGRILP